MTPELLRKATLFTLTLNKWGNRRKADVNMVEVEADKRALSLTKRLIDSPQYDAIVRYQRDVKQWCKDRCMPSFIREGVFVVALTEVVAFEQYLRAAREHLEGVLVPAFCEEYGKQIVAARETLGALFNEADYPSEHEVRKTFGISWGWISFGVPDNIPPEVREQEVEKFKKMFTDAQEEVLVALRAAFKELVAHAVERLKIEPGKPKPVLRDSLVENFEEFFETFTAKNFMEDAELSEVVEKARMVVRGLNVETAREDDDHRGAIAGKMEGVLQEVDKLIEERPSRRFALNEEDEA